jgi:hypothetical protein
MAVHILCVCVSWPQADDLRLELPSSRAHDSTPHIFRSIMNDIKLIVFRTRCIHISLWLCCQAWLFSDYYKNALFAAIELAEKIAPRTSQVYHCHGNHNRDMTAF